MVRKCDRKLSVENLEMRRVLAASFGWDGPGVGSAELTYYLGDAPASLGREQFETAIETALKAWSEVVDVNFTQARQPGLQDSLDFTFANIDGRGSVLAQAYFPDDVNPSRIAGDIQFDSSERWEIGNSLGNAAFDLVAVAVHEIGHALGLDHIAHAGSILRPSISPNQTFTGLSQDDIDAIRGLYAEAPANDSPDTPVPDTPVPDDGRNPTRPDTPTRPENPWNRLRWVWRVALPRINFGGFGGIAAEVSLIHNLYNPTDVNNDSTTTALDALLVINTINSGDLHSVHLCDTNNDGLVSAMDVMLVINRLNKPADGAPIETVDLGTPAAEPARLPNTELDAPLDDSNQDVDGELFVGFGLGHRLLRVREAALVSLFEDFDKDNNGLTEQELPEFLWNIMLRNNVDTDRDGVVSRSEVDTAIDRGAMRVFDQFDDNADGQLTQTELPDRIWERVVRADKNEDGGVSFAELRSYQTLSKFERMDSNGDGGVTQQEVPERVWERLSRFDTSADNMITADELPEHQFASRLEQMISRLSDFAARIFQIFGR
jgi:Ca2+-binding EF-hand superfamily protein